MKGSSVPSTYKNIVFVCTGNSCRSVFAEYYFLKRVNEVGKGDISVSSAGTSASPLFNVPGVVIRLLQKEGIRYINHTPTTITEKIAEHADVLLCMENHHVFSLNTRFPNQKNKIILFHEFARGGKKDIPDPIGQGDSFYELTFKEIKNCIEEIVKKI